MGGGYGSGPRARVLRRQAEPWWKVVVELDAACRSARRRVPGGPNAFRRRPGGHPVCTVRHVRRWRDVAKVARTTKPGEAQRSAQPTDNAGVSSDAQLRVECWSPDSGRCPPAAAACAPSSPSAARSATCAATTWAGASAVAGGSRRRGCACSGNACSGECARCAAAFVESCRRGRTKLGGTSRRWPLFYWPAGSSEGGRCCAQQRCK